MLSCIAYPKPLYGQIDEPRRASSEEAFPAAASFSEFYVEV